MSVNQEVENPKTPVEVPYTDYQNVNKKPYVVDYLELGDQYEEAGYKEEIDAINDYFKTAVEQGYLENKTEAIKHRLKNIEKMAGVDKSERMVVRVAKIKAYTDFLKETRNIEKLIQKYGQR